MRLTPARTTSPHSAAVNLHQALSAPKPQALRHNQAIINQKPDMSEDTIHHSFELIADRVGDITPQVYEKYFSTCPDSEALLLHLDDVTRGKMMDEIYRLMMVDDYKQESDYLNWEVVNHEAAYSVEPHMYEGLFDALINVVSEALGSDFTPQVAEAWQQRTAALQKEILSRFTAHS